MKELIAGLIGLSIVACIWLVSIAVPVTIFWLLYKAIV